MFLTCLLKCHLGLGIKRFLFNIHDLLWIRVHSTDLKRTITHMKVKLCVGYHAFFYLLFYIFLRILFFPRKIHLHSYWKGLEKASPTRDILVCGLLRDELNQGLKISGIAFTFPLPALKILDPRPGPGKELTPEVTPRKWVTWW